MNEKTATTPWRSDLAMIAGFSLLAVLIQLAASFLAGYGIFRDEYYYLACSRRLALGYVDQPPLSIFFLGDQPLAVRGNAARPAAAPGAGGTALSFS